MYSNSWRLVLLRRFAGLNIVQNSMVLCHKTRSNGSWLYKKLKCYSFRELKKNTSNFIQSYISPIICTSKFLERYCVHFLGPYSSWLISFQFPKSYKIQFTYLAVSSWYFSSYDAILWNFEQCKSCKTLKQHQTQAVCIQFSIQHVHFTIMLCAALFFNTVN